MRYFRDTTCIAKVQRCVAKIWAIEQECCQLYENIWEIGPERREEIVLMVEARRHSLRFEYEFLGRYVLDAMRNGELSELEPNGKD